MRPEERWQLSAAERVLLAERAWALAEPATALDLEAPPTLVTLTVGSDFFAVEARSVREVIRQADVQPVPAARPPVLGVLVVRGAILVAMSLRDLLGLPADQGFAPLDIVVVGGRERAVGVAVTRVVGLAAVPERAVGPAPPLADVELRYVTGEVEIGGRTALLLDLDRLVVSEGLKQRTLRASGDLARGSVP